MANESQKKQGSKTAQQRGLFDHDRPQGFYWKGLVRYGWDLAGVLTFSGALILLLGVTGITKGVLITPVSQILGRWLGVGRFVVVIMLIVVGIYLVRWRKHPPERIALGRIVSFEFSVFFFMGILSMFSGHSLTKAEAGLDWGGLVGWGIAELVQMIAGPTVAVIILFVFLALSLIGAFDLISGLEKVVQERLGELPAGNAVKAGFSQTSSEDVVAQEDESEEEDESEKKKVWLPPEYRKTLETPDFGEEIPVDPAERSPDLPPLDMRDV